MVSLPCRRARKTKDAHTMPDTALPEPEAAQTQNTPAHPAVERVYTSEERKALQSLFQQMNLPDSHTNPVMPVTQQPTTKETHSDERHSRLELLSKRLRSRLSKESRLLKSRSKSSIVQRNYDLAENQPPTFPDSNILPDILGSGPASEGGYDSDAQNIMTPCVEPSIASSTDIPVENANRKNLKDDATIPCQEVCSRKNTPNAENIKEIIDLQNSNMDARSESSISEVFGSPCTSVTNETRTAPPTTAIKMPPNNDTILNAGCSKLDVSSERTSPASEPAKPSEDTPLVFPQRSFSLAIPLPNRLTSAANQNVGSPLGTVSKPLEDLSSVSGTLNSQDSALTTPDIQIHRRDTSSMYASHPNSLPPSPESSAHGFPLPLPGEIGSIDATASMNEVPTAVTMNRPDLVENNPISKPKREPSVTRQESQVWALEDTLLLSNGPVQGPPTQSKFTEQLGSVDTKQNNTEDPQRRNRESSSGDSRRTSDGWLSGGKRKGYGYEFVSETDEDTDIMWKRVIKAHAEGSVRARQQSQNSFSWKGKRPSMKYSRDSSEHSIAKQHPAIHVLPEERTPSRDKGKIPAPGIGLVKSKKEKNAEKTSVRSLRAWTKFPSHSRSERCASASTTDKVTVRDFSSTQDQRPILESSLSSPQVDGQVERDTPRKSGRDWFRQWTKLSRPSSVDLRRYRAGHWAGVSRSGHLKYPELELIPDGPRPYVVMEELGNVEKANKKFLRQQKEQNRVVSSSKVNGPDINQTDMPNPETGPKAEPNYNSDSGSATGTEENEFFLAPFFPLTPEHEPDSSPTVIGETASIEPSMGNVSAQMWSRLYEDCVNRPTSDNGADALSSTSVPSSRAASPERAQDRKLTAISTSMDLNSSTTEFKKFQLSDEVKTRDSLLRMVEAAWGTGLSDRGVANSSQSY